MKILSQMRLWTK